MDNFTLRKQEANELRKGKDFSRALPIYRELWEETKDKFDGVGLLSCLRNLNSFDEALPFADELIIKFPDFKWCRLEVIWTYIQGRLDKLREGAQIEDVVKEADKIMKLEPEGLARKIVVFKVLKFAKGINRGDIIDAWLNQINPEELSKEPIKDKTGREGWCDQSLWYNYHIKRLLERNDTQTVISSIDQLIETFPSQKKFFLRFKALAYSTQGNLTEAERIYYTLSERYPTDWWILHEYAKVLRNLDKKEEALKLLCRAALVNQGKLETMVSLFEDVGSLLKEIGKYEESRAHLLLSRFIRTNHKWSLKEPLLKAILDVKRLINKDNDPTSLQEALKICKNFWEKTNPDQSSKITRPSRNELIGTLSLGAQERPFCFINIANESIFCFKSDLPANAQEGQIVIFDAKPSYDKKKSKESWKAINIRIK